jgi:Type III restriction enzyme, res subunit
MTTLRPYQQDLVAEYERKAAADIRRILIVAPTGGGKTIIASEIIKRAVAAHKQVLFVAHRDELLTQARDRLKGFDIVAGIIKAGREQDAGPWRRFKSPASKRCTLGRCGQRKWNYRRRICSSSMKGTTSER